jgi:hypothetical protein
MKKLSRKKRLIILGAILLCIFLLFFLFLCRNYRKYEEQYQYDADIIRIRHFDYYAQLLTEYFEKNGKYPFQYEKNDPVYVYLLTDFQEKNFKDTNPYKHHILNDKYFFEELSKGLNKDIIEKYDPQKVSSDKRPNMYIYMVDKDNFYFAIHLYHSNKFTKNIVKYYHKMELSNVDDVTYTLFSYKTLENDPQYIELLNRNPKNEKYFEELEEQCKTNSKDK